MIFRSSPRKRGPRAKHVSVAKAGPPLPRGRTEMRFRWRRFGVRFSSSPQPRERAFEELAAMAQAFLVDTVADAFGEMPLHRNTERGKPARGLEHRLRWNEIVAVAMHQ